MTIGDTAIIAAANDNQNSAGITPQRRTTNRLSRYLVFALVLSVFGAVMWLERMTYLQGAANLWVVSDQITPADAVVVLGGGIEVRPVVAADLYTKGLVHKILVSRVKDERAVSGGAVPGQTELNLEVLRTFGVPDSSIELFGNGNQNTWDEAIALKRWTERHAITAVIIPAEPFFTRRVRWVFRHEFAGTGVRIEVPSYDPPGRYSRTGWWKTWEGVIAFRNEVLKYIYYRLKY